MTSLLSRRAAIIFTTVNLLIAAEITVAVLSNRADNAATRSAMTVLSDFVKSTGEDTLEAVGRFERLVQSQTQP